MMRDVRCRRKEYETLLPSDLREVENTGIHTGDRGKEYDTSLKKKREYKYFLFFLFF